jgi:hypothetical protein
VVVVEGTVEEGPAPTVWLVANDRRVSVRMEHGRFRHALPLLEPVVVLWAETRAAGGQLLQWSRAVVVHAASRTSSGAVLMLTWPREVTVVRADVTVIWRAHSDRTTAPIHTLPLKRFGTAAASGLPEIMYLTDLKPGVYTFVLRHEVLGVIDRMRPTLHLADAGKLASRELGFVPLARAGTTVLARVLLPYMVHWDQDEWFTGRVRSGDAVTKFRLPEGITWTERSVDLR